MPDEGSAEVEEEKEEVGQGGGEVATEGVVEEVVATDLLEADWEEVSLGEMTTPRIVVLSLFFELL